MDPNLHKARREARAEYVQRTLALRNETVYVDAATYAGKGEGNKHKVATVIGPDLREIQSASIRNCTVVEAEEVAVALAAVEGYRLGKSLTILTDSQTACRNYMNGRISRKALNILLSNGRPTDKQSKHAIVWIPGHTSVEGNLEADRIARGYATNRASKNTAAIEDPEPVGQTYADTLNYFRGARMRYPAPDKQLNREEAVIWRQLQTGTYLNLYILNKIYPTQYENTCPWCGDKPTLYHITWACQKAKEITIIENPSAEQWERMLSSDILKVQQGLVRRARTAATLSGALD
ncbi:uncharacterized protein [Dermacentor albipictus]|uniref:uncharacterized protein n=1 Tax=Dermacentor albipictus TaxID=60249 RepID=UPI0038FCB4F3